MRRWRRWLLAGAPLLLLAGLLPALAGGVLSSIGGARAAQVQAAQVAAVAGSSEPSCLAVVMRTMRTVESGERYDLPPNKGGASGGYQIIDPTWRAYATRAGVDPGIYPQAWLAPPEVQDQVVAVAVRAFLDAGNPVANVPVYWYLPAALGNPNLMDVVPMPEAGNMLTPREYQTRWLGVFQRFGGCVPSTTATELTDADLAAVNVAEAGMEQYANGCIPLSTLVHVQGPADTATDADPCKLMLSGYYLAPATALSFMRLAQEAGADGVVLRITSAYRSRAKQAQLFAQLGNINTGGLAMAAGASPHGLGIAADIDVLDPKVLAWLRANGPRLCWTNAAPAREPWHWQRTLACT